MQHFVVVGCGAVVVTVGCDSVVVVASCYSVELLKELLWAMVLKLWMFLHGRRS